MWSIPGGELLPYISYVDICRHKAYGFWGLFRLKAGINLAHFGLESGKVFDEPTGAYA